MAVERVQKIISSLGVCSRRKAEEYISRGLVTVNGKKVTLGDKADISADKIYLDGKLISSPKKSKNRDHRYYALNKPRGYVTTMSDELGRKCVADLLTDIDTRVYPVGRLDRDSEGLLLLTNDGDFSNLVTHPSNRILKTYRVSVVPAVRDEDLDRLIAGTYVDGDLVVPAEVSIVTDEKERSVLSITINEGKNREIRKMVEGLGYEVKRLKRTSIGCVSLGHMKPGEIRELTRAERQGLSKLKHTRSRETE
ncbi:MAG: rRNA pseudouridine synthase [Oscillospiraceae bacterium]|nr:rRNA pseudouridine synthase [Oscillospiraceae bacterium]